MKKNENFILRDIAGENILVPTGEYSQDFNGLISLNGTAAFIWKHIDDCETAEDMIKLVLDHYEIDEKQASKDVKQMIEILYNNGMIEL